MHLVFLPKFYITIVSNLSWVFQSSQEKSKAMAVQIYLEGMERGGGGRGGEEGGGVGRACRYTRSIMVYEKMVYMVRLKIFE